MESKNKFPAKESESKEVAKEEKSKNWQSFKVLKQFPTSGLDNVVKIYEVGETFKHYDKRVINFLKANKII